MQKTASSFSERERADPKKAKTTKKQPEKHQFVTKKEALWTRKNSRKEAKKKRKETIKILEMSQEAEKHQFATKKEAN
ncbi:hypothetical protein AA0482_0785 [Acetobacter cibinongensis NRIC 0482]|nr:hypothetical protein AA0482_0785 [Acetobacter cibinongensis NRIC 0482]